MKTELEKLEQEYQEKKAKLEQELAIRSMLPDVGFSWRIHCYALYGSFGRLKIEQPFRGYSIDDKPTPSFSTLHAMAEALPGLPLLRCKGTFVSFIPEENLSTYEEKSRSKIKHIENLAPWIVKGESYGGSGKCTLEWWSKLPNGQIWEVNFELPYRHYLSFYAHSKNYMGGKRYDDWGITIDRNKLYTVSSSADSGKPVAELGISTKYASGDATFSPGSSVAVWTPLDDPCQATVLDFALALTLADAKE
jgi:hypothetical protein